MTAGSSPLDGTDFRQAWARLDKPARRRVRRAVNRAQPAENPTEAAIAAAMASGQRRMWRYAWLFGPVVAGVLNVAQGWETVLANVAFATALFGFMGFVFSWKARRAERTNRAVVEEARGKRRSKARPQRNPTGKARGAKGPGAARSRKSRKRRKRRR